MLCRTRSRPSPSCTAEWRRYQRHLKTEIKWNKSLFFPFKQYYPLKEYDMRFKLKPLFTVTSLSAHLSTSVWHHVCWPLHSWILDKKLCFSPPQNSEIKLDWRFCGLCLVRLLLYPRIPIPHAFSVAGKCDFHYLLSERCQSNNGCGCVLLKGM